VRAIAAGRTGRRIFNVSQDANLNDPADAAFSATLASQYTSTATAAAPTSGPRRRSDVLNAVRSRGFASANQANAAPCSQHAPTTIASATTALHTSAGARDSPSPSQ